MHRRLTDKRLSRAHLRIQLSHSDCEGSQRTAKLKTQNAILYHGLLPVGYRDVYYIAMASGMPAYRLSGSAAASIENTVSNNIVASQDPDIASKLNDHEAMVLLLWEYLEQGDWPEADKDLDFTMLLKDVLYVYEDLL